MQGLRKLGLVSCACWLAILGWMIQPQRVGCELNIIRKVNTKDVYHKDRFNIPKSKCIEIRQGNKCAVYGGFERSPSNPCKCHCPPLKGTMVLRKNRWKCTGNAELRLREGKPHSCYHHWSVLLVVNKSLYYITHQYVNIVYFNATRRSKTFHVFAWFFDAALFLVWSLDFRNFSLNLVHEALFHPFFHMAININVSLDIFFHILLPRVNLERFPQSFRSIRSVLCTRNFQINFDPPAGCTS